MNKIGRGQGAGLLATTLLGTSVFILPQMTIDIAGQNALWVWFALTLAVLPVAIVFSQLAGRFPHAAGPANFVEQAFGKVAGRAIGISFLLVVPIGAPASLIMTYQFVAEIYPQAQSVAIWVQLGFVGLIFLLNMRGIKLSAGLQLMLALLIAGALLAMLATLSTHPGSYRQPDFNWSLDETAITAAGLAFWSFLGIEAMAHLSGDFENPKRDLLPAIIAGTVLVGLIYLLCAYLILAVPSNTELRIVGVFNSLFGAGGALILGWLGIAGGLATVNVYTASLSRLIWSFSCDGVLPSCFSKRNQNDVPVMALVCLIAVMATVLVLTSTTGQDLERLINLVNGVFVIVYAASMLAALKLLERRYTYLVALSLGFCFFMVWGIGANMLYALLILLVCCPLLFLQSKRQSKVRCVAEE